MAQVGINETTDPYEGGIDKVTSIFKITKQDLQKLFSNEITIENRMNTLQEYSGVDGLLEKLQTHKKSGIMGDERDLNRRQRFFGFNRKPAPAPTNFGESLKEAFQEKLLLILAICAFLSIIFGMIYEPKTGWVEGVSIYVVLALGVLITSVNDYIKDKCFVDLQAVAKDSNLGVFRGKMGQMQTINMWDLVVGDVIQLNAGDVVPADCIIMKSDYVNVIAPNSEKGEGVHLPRGDSNPFIICDEQLMTGSCIAVVACVGDYSTRIQIEPKLNTSETQLQQKLYPLTKTFIFIGIIVSFCILVTAIVIQCIQTGVNEEVGGKIFMTKLFQNITLFFVLIMVAVPEGLPLSVEISLSQATKRMYSKEKILVRKLDAPERMGQITQINTGLTGTLTTGEMSVVKFFAQDTMITNSRKDTITHSELTKDIQTHIQESILWNTECHVELNDKSHYVPVGNDTERGFLKWLQDAEIAVHDFCVNRFKYEVARIPFNSIEKRSIVAIRHPNMEDTVRVFVKGASEVILPNCECTFDKNGDKVPLDEDKKASMMEQMKEEMSRKGLRTLGFSYKDMSEDEFAEMKERTKNFFNQGSSDELASNQTFIAFVAQQDPLRDQVKKAMKRASRAGITVRIVTNNSLETSTFQAEQCGLLQDGYQKIENKDSLGYAMEASELMSACGGLKEELNEDGETIFMPVDINAFEQKVENLVVLARATPQDKLLLTAGLKALGKLTAVIGDGNNDIQSFGASHVSFCMGSGSSIAKQESDIVLTDNDFFDCMNAVMYGRNIYTNIKRFLMFQITANFSCLITVFIGFFYLTESPFSSTQLLWINLVIDTFAALALATLPPMTSVLDEPAIAIKGHQILQKPVWRQIYGITLWNVIIMCIVIFGGKSIFDLPYANSTMTTERGDDGKLTKEAENKLEHLTIVYNIFIQLLWFNEWNCRVVGAKEFNVLKKFFSSPLFLFIMIGTAVMQWLMCNWLSWLVATANLDNQVYFRCVAWGFTVIPVAMILKLTPESWVEKMPIAINEDEVLGQGSLLMKGYDKANASRKISIKQSEVQETETDQIDDVQTDNKDDEFKQA